MNMIERRTLLIGMATLGTLGWARSTFAQDEGLYAKAIDPNSAFVRVLAPGAASAVVNGKSIGQLQDGLSPYVNVQPGDISVSAGSASGTVTATPGQYFTFVSDASGKGTTLKDMKPDDPSKAAVYLYNLSDLDKVNLFVPAANANALSDVAQLGSKGVLLKAPLTIGAEIKSNDKVVAKIASIDLKRKNGVSIIVTGSGGTYSASAVDNSITR